MTTKRKAKLKNKFSDHTQPLPADNVFLVGEQHAKASDGNPGYLVQWLWLSFPRTDDSGVTCCPGGCRRRGQVFRMSRQQLDCKKAEFLAKGQTVHEEPE